MAITDTINCDCDSGPAARTFGELRAAVYEACGFISPKIAGTGTLSDMRQRVHQQLGFAAMGANYAPGMSDLIDTWLNEAQLAIWRRVESGGGAQPSWMEDDADESDYDDGTIVTLALANAKAHYGMPDAKVYFDRFERDMADVAGRQPPNAKTLVENALRSANKQLYMRYDALHTERYFSWPLVAGQARYGVTDNAETCAKKLEPLKIRWAGVQDTTDQGWRPIIAGIPATAHGDTQTGRIERYEVRGCIEVWPVPADTEGVLVIKGHYTPEPFGVAVVGPPAIAADDTMPAVDDEALLLFATANVKAAYKQPDAQNYMQMAESRVRRLVAGSHGTRRYVPGGTREAPAYVEPKFVGPW